jgi:GTP-binding protein LepA
MEILIAGRKEEAFSKIVPRDKAFSEGKSLTKKLKDSLPNQMFTVAIQAVVGGNIIARETISAKRKDVTAPLYGGDYTRKKKLLEKQKKGKKALKEKGEVNIPPKVFLEVLKG